MVKTTLRLPSDIWRAARVRALDDRISFQDLVERALHDYLKSASKPRGERR
ncbi:MAG: hypothetical protein ACREMY_00415 [bacterium]